MRRILLAAFIGAFLVSAPASAQPVPFPRDRDRDRDYDRDRGPSRQSREVVTGWFVHFFNTQPDSASLVIWSRQLDQSNNPDQVLARMVGESVYYDQAGDTPEGFVQKLFRDLTGRDPSRRDFGFWMDRLNRASGGSPDTEDRTNLAYDMIKRYPPNASRDRDDDYDYRRHDAWRDR